MLHVIDDGLSDPRESIALDAAFLAALEDREIGATLRFWESRCTAVVVGFSGVVAREVDEPACFRDKVPIIRRCSGGGAVVVAPGCLNYSLFLSLDARPELGDVRDSYRRLLGRVVEELRVPGLAHRGSSDLAVGRRKVSGNAQRRGRRALLHHGTFLYEFDLPKIGRYLREPVRQPDYRKGRPHAAFVANLSSDAGAIKETLTRAFGSISSTTAHHTPAFTSSSRDST
jgi:lipoate-protein ligase A